LLNPIFYKAGKARKLIGERLIVNPHCILNYIGGSLYKLISAGNSLYSAVERMVIIINIRSQTITYHLFKVTAQTGIRKFVFVDNVGMLGHIFQHIILGRFNLL